LKGRDGFIRQIRIRVLQLEPEPELVLLADAIENKVMAASSARLRPIA